MVRNRLILFRLFIAFVFLAGLKTTAFAQTNAFTYEGQLLEGGKPTTGDYVMLFYLYDAPTNGNKLGNLGVLTVPVSNGVFIVTLDFGDVFKDNTRWLEINAQTKGARSFTTLAPRQPVKPTAKALAQVPVADTKKIVVPVKKEIKKAAQKPAEAKKEEKTPEPTGPQTDGHFRKVILDTDRQVDGKWEDTLENPMELAVAKDGRVFYAERGGSVKVWSPQTKATQVLGKIEVYSGQEDGLLGITLDPDFLKNGWVYLYHALPQTITNALGKKAGTNRISRFTITADKLDLASEKKMLDVGTQREQCCHAGGSMAFDTKGNLYISTGDNTNPFDSDGFSPSDERVDRSPWDAQKSAANENDLRGKVLRIHPEKDGSYTIPKKNLFPKKGFFGGGKTQNTRPEIYVMGCRNPFRISIDSKTGFLYWGDVGPDSSTASETRGSAGLDELNQARKAGNFGWPLFVGDNKPYWHWDFEKRTNVFKNDPMNPINRSPNNTGPTNLPPAQPAMIFYPSSQSTRFPIVGSGGRTAMAGPVYYFDPKLKSDTKLPIEFDHTLFFYEWSRNWIVAVHLDKDDKIAKMEKFCPNMTFKRPMDIELGPDGCLYLIEWGTAWGSNKDTQIVRIEYQK